MLPIGAKGVGKSSISANLAIALSRLGKSDITPFVVVNRVRTGNDANTGKVIQGLMENYLGIKSSELMTIREDIAVGKAIAKMKPVMTETPNSPFSRDIEQIALKLCE